MIRVRFHGRGGQGMKTASRVVGTAALLDGFEAQDSPVYGAERRGAPMAAFVRIAREPIRERGAIPTPDLVVVADDTLLDDPAVKPLAGLPATGTLVLATAHPAEEVRRHTGHPGPLVARDFLALALEQVGTVAGVSTALAAVTCALLGLSARATLEGLETELEAIGLSPSLILDGLRLGTLARAGLDPVVLPVPSPTLVSPGPPGSPESVLVDVAYAPPEVGTPSVRAAPNTPLRKTGSWRVFRPVIDLARCTRCWICFVRCPEGAITLDAEDTPSVDYEVCKGCLICLEECPPHAITAAREDRVWADTAIVP